MAFNFDQKKYMKSVFTFIDRNDLTIREFCALAKVSAATLYRARDTDCPMDITTIRKLDSAMSEYLKRGI